MIKFSKMHGIGNDFVVIDAIREPLNGLDLSALSKAMCDRRHGVGSDGILVVDRGRSAPFRMRMFNPDGSESEMCGNGVRCIALMLKEHGHTRENEIPLETLPGLLTLRIKGTGCVEVDMGRAGLIRGEIGMSGPPNETFKDQPIEIDGKTMPGTAVSMGNPHLVCFVEDAASVPLEKWGPTLEKHKLFPNRVNVHFVQVLARDLLLQRTWERGAGVTLACGTGACASAVAGFITGRSERVATVRLPGGELRINYPEKGGVLMTGPAQKVFDGVWVLGD